MNSENERPGNRGDLRFFGAVTASVTHELNNVLSIIDQVAGLFADHLAALRAGRPIDPERLTEIQMRIARQASRGDEIVKRLNAFAHTVDEPRVRFSAPDVLGNLAAVCRRFVTLRQATLAVELPAEPVWLEGDPFALQLAVFSLLQQLLPCLDDGDVLTLAASTAGRDFTVRLIGPRSASTGRAGRRAPAIELDARWDKSLHEALEVIGASLVRQNTTVDGGPATCVAITLPVQRV